MEINIQDYLNYLIERGIAPEAAVQEAEHLTDFLQQQVSKQKLTLPDSIPQGDLYRNRPIDPDTGRKQSIVKFLQSGWPRPYIEARILTRPALSKLDRAAYNDLQGLKEDLPPDIIIPSKNDLIKQEQVDPEQIRTAQRFFKRGYRERVLRRSENQRDK